VESTESKPKHTRNKKPPEEYVPIVDFVDEALDQLRPVDDITLEKIINLREGDPSVRMPLSPPVKYPPDKFFKPGANGSKESDYRLEVRAALEANPQLFIQLLHKMTPPQRYLMVLMADLNYLSHAFNDMAKRFGGTPESWRQRYTQYSIPTKEAIRFGGLALQGDAINVGVQLRRLYFAKAVMVKASGLDSDDETIRQKVATELIEWETGRAGVRIQMDVDNKGDALMKRIAAATEKAAGMKPAVNIVYDEAIPIEDEEGESG
jgi:hypothetical protein